MTAEQRIGGRDIRNRICRGLDCIAREKATAECVVKFLMILTLFKDKEIRG
jgi:hypothetical protein